MRQSILVGSFRWSKFAIRSTYINLSRTSTKYSEDFSKNYLKIFFFKTLNVSIRFQKTSKILASNDDSNGHHCWVFRDLVHRDRRVNPSIVLICFPDHSLVTIYTPGSRKTKWSNVFVYANKAMVNQANFTDLPIEDPTN